MDLFWDASRQLWSLCPAELGSPSTAPASSPAASGVLSTASSVQSSSSSTPIASLSSAVLSERGILADEGLDVRGQTSPPRVDRAAQVDAAVTSSASTSSAVATTASSLTDAVSSTVTLGTNSSASPAESSSSTATPSAPTSDPGDDSTLYSVGPYLCSADANVDLFFDVLQGHFKDTSDRLNATLKYVDFRIHAAASASDPGGSPRAPAESNLPSSGNSLSANLNTNLSSYLYTPSQLQSQRANLNTSWASSNTKNYPTDLNYFNTNVASNGFYSTPDGWPSEGFVVLSQARRLVVGYGTIDPQMAGYNVSEDVDTIFPNGYLTASQDISKSTSTGELTGGCLFQSGETTIAAVNSSWAIAPDTTNTSLSAVGNSTAFNTITNITACGISPILNATLSSRTPAQDPSDYETFVRGTIWSFGPTEPSDSDDSPKSKHCAALNITASSFWEVADCTDHHYAACRTPGVPYDWRISSSSGAYDQIDSDLCPGDSFFAAPRTPLEQAYLRVAVEKWIQEQSDDDNGPLFWVDWNDLDITGCWVSGANSTCPYRSTSTSATRTVVVPTVAAVIVFVCCALLVFVKCAANRRSSKRRRRRGEDGSDYEGVPS